MGFPGGVSHKELACQCRRHKRCGSNSWVRKIPYRRAWLPTPVFLPGEFPWIEEPGVLQSIGLQCWLLEFLPRPSLESACTLKVTS